MELVELHVRDLGAGAVRHRDAVARRDVGVRRVEVDLAGAAGGEHRRARDDGLDLARALVEHVRAEHGVRAAVLGGSSAGRRPDVIGQDGDAVGASATRASSAAGCRARSMSLRGRCGGRVCPPSRPRSKWPSASRSKWTPSSLRARMCSGPSRTQHLHDVAVAQAVAARSVSSTCASKLVVRDRARRPRRPAPSSCWRRRGALRDDHDAPVLGGAQREVEPGDARSDHEVVGLQHEVDSSAGSRWGRTGTRCRGNPGQTVQHRFWPTCGLSICYDRPGSMSWLVLRWPRSCCRAGGRWDLLVRHKRTGWWSSRTAARQGALEGALQDGPCKASALRGDGPVPAREPSAARFASFDSEHLRQPGVLRHPGGVPAGHHQDRVGLRSARGLQRRGPGLMQLLPETARLMGVTAASTRASTSWAARGTCRCWRAASVARRLRFPLPAARPGRRRSPSARPTRR